MTSAIRRALFIATSASIFGLLPSPVSAIPSQKLGVVVCAATAIPPVVRAEGISERVGEIILSCQNDPPAVGGSFDAYLITNLSLSLNVNITSNKGFEAQPDITDAVMIVNENNCMDPQPSSVFGACGASTPTVQDPQHGVLAAVNRLEWHNFSFPIPGTAIDGAPVADCTGVIGVPGGCHPFTTTIRITNVRANASQLGIPDPEAIPETQVMGFVSITGPNTIPVTNNVLNVAIPIRGMIANFTKKAAGLQCFDGNEHFVAEFEQTAASTRAAAHLYYAKHVDLARGESPAPHVYAFVEPSGDRDRRLISAARRDSLRCRRRFRNHQRRRAAVQKTLHLQGLQTGLVSGTITPAQSLCIPRASV